MIDNYALNKVVCPGCGWIGVAGELAAYRGACPVCCYENGVEPYRLLTLSEMLKSDTEYADIRMDLFLASVFKLVR